MGGVPPPPRREQRGKAYTRRMLAKLIGSKGAVVTYEDLMTHLGLDQSAVAWPKSKHILFQTKRRVNANRWVQLFGYVTVKSGKGYRFVYKIDPEASNGKVGSEECDQV